MQSIKTINYPITLTVGSGEARRLIDQIPHGTCRGAAKRHWNAGDGGTVPIKSVNWLFCWGKTGMGSRPAADEAKRVFDTIFPITFLEYDQIVNHEQARMHMYYYQD